MVDVAGVDRIVFILVSNDDLFLGGGVRVCVCGGVRVSDDWIMWLRKRLAGGDNELCQQTKGIKR